MNRILTALLSVSLMTVAANGAAILVNNVPDWHQPCLIGAPNGPNNGPAPLPGQANYKAWCTPTAAANVMGFWNDVMLANVADGKVYVAKNLLPWNPPPPAPGNPTNWQDDGADASSIPTVNGGVRAAGASDLGWYLNTNDQGDQVGVPNNGGNPAVGEQFAGTKRVNIVPGVQNYLTAHGYANAVVAKVGGGAANIQAGWNQIVAEINAGRPLMADFDHFNIVQRVPGGQGEYDWGSPSNHDPQTGEDWDESAGLGHTTTVVGYWDANDLANPNPGIHSIIVQDSRVYNLLFPPGPEPLNGLFQITLPFAQPVVAGPWVAKSPWDSNVAIAIPEPATALLLTLGAMAFVRRPRRNQGPGGADRS